MLICLPGLTSKANMTNSLFYSTRQLCKGYYSIPSLKYHIFYNCTDRSVAHTYHHPVGSGWRSCFQSCYSNGTMLLC